MALSIRNPRAERLARQIAAESGESIPEAVIHALEEKLRRLRERRGAPDVAEELIRISVHCKAMQDAGQRDSDGTIDSGGKAPRKP